MDASVQAVHTFHKNLVSFFDELIDMFPEEGDFVLYRIMVKDQVPITEVIRHISEYLLPEKEAVKEAIKHAVEDGNVAPFNQRINDMFAKLGGTSKTTNYKKMFDEMDDESKIAIWKWLQLFIHLLEKCRK